MGDDYQVKKMDVDVIVEDVIDLTPFRGIGVQPGEEIGKRQRGAHIHCEMISLGHP